MLDNCKHEKTNNWHVTGSVWAGWLRPYGTGTERCGNSSAARLQPVYPLSAPQLPPARRCRYPLAHAVRHAPSASHDAS